MENGKSRRQLSPDRDDGAGIYHLRGGKLDRGGLASDYAPRSSIIILLSRSYCLELCQRFNLLLLLLLRREFSIHTMEFFSNFLNNAFSTLIKR